MELTFKIEKTVNVEHIQVMAIVRYWEDSIINGIEDENGDLTPCRDGENWCPLISVEDGVIENWKIGTKADIHFKVTDRCGFKLIDEDGNVVFEELDGYVPTLLCPKENGFGDYIIMDVDEKGKIDGWNKNGMSSIFSED